MIFAYQTYGKLEAVEHHRIDSGHTIDVIAIKNYKGIIELFYVNWRDERSKQAFLTLAKSGKQMLLTTAYYTRKAKKRFLIEVEDKQFHFNEG